MKINIIKAGTTAALAIMLLIVSGCKKDFLDVNVDPNNPEKAALNLILPLTQLNIANGLGMGPSGLSDATSVFVSQTNQRSNNDGYAITSNDFGVTQPWSFLYTGALVNLDQIIKLGTEQQNYSYVGIAQILQAYTYSMMVDVWGDVPYSEALRAPEIFYPKWDKGKDIYPQLFTLIDNGIANLDKTSQVAPTGDDLIYGGNLTKWKKFANTLKLKMYNQVRLVQDVTGPINELLRDGTPDKPANEFLSASSDDFQFLYGTLAAPENRHPAFINEYVSAGKSNYISPYFWEILMNKSTLNPILSGIKDPRVPYYFYNQATADAPTQFKTEYRDGGFISIFFGSTGVNQGFDQSLSQTVLGLYPAGGKYDIGDGKTVNLSSGKGDSPQRLLTYDSYLYLRAEIALTLGIGGDPKSYLEQAMKASFKKVNEVASAVIVTPAIPQIQQSVIDTYVNAVLLKYDDAANNAGKLELIMTEKWIASFGFAVDTYTDYRRTGYPKLFDPNTDDISYTSVSRDFPVSFPYRLQDIQTNPNNPGQRNVTTDKVFWQP